jgi:hypothetical protein
LASGGGLWQAAVAFGKRMKKRFKSIKCNGVIYQGIGLLVDPKAG